MGASRSGLAALPKNLPRARFTSSRLIETHDFGSSKPYTPTQLPHMSSRLRHSSPPRSKSNALNDTSQIWHGVEMSSTTSYCSVISFAMTPPRIHEYSLKMSSYSRKCSQSTPSNRSR